MHAGLLFAWLPVSPRAEPERRNVELSLGSQDLDTAWEPVDARERGAMRQLDGYPRTDSGIAPRYRQVIDAGWRE